MMTDLTTTKKKMNVNVQISIQGVQVGGWGIKYLRNELFFLPLDNTRLL